MTFPLALIAFSGYLLISTSVINGEIVEAPRNAVGVLGQSITLTCKLTGGGLTWQFRKMGEVLSKGFSESNNNAKRQVTAGGDGSYNLQINDLDYNDVGVYVCQDQDFNKKGAHLSIINNAGEPQSSYSSGPLLENEVVTTTCTASYVSDDLIMTLEVTDGTTSSMQSGTAFDTTTETQVTANIQQTAQRPKLAPVECRYVFKLPAGGNTEPDVDIEPSIAYVTKVPELYVWFCADNVKVDPLMARYLRNDRITCTAEGYPEPTIKWVDKATGETLVNGNVVRISRNLLTNTTYRYECIADNAQAGFVCTASTYLLSFMVYVVPYNILMWLIPLILFLSALLLIAIGYVCCRFFAVGGTYRRRRIHQHLRYDSSIVIDPTQHGHVVSRYNNLSAMTAREMMENPIAYGSHTGIAAVSN